MTRQRHRSLDLVIGAICLFHGGLVMAGPPPGFCPGATPLPEDEFEIQPLIDGTPATDDDSMATARFVEVPNIANRRHSFHDDLDEDWVQFRGSATPMGGQPILYQAFGLIRDQLSPYEMYGPGIPLVDTDMDFIPDEGTGLRIQLFDDLGMPVIYDGFEVDSFKPGGNPNITACDDGGAVMPPMLPIQVSVEFEVPADGDYFLRISQCRNAPEFAGFVPCIPDEPQYEFQLGFSAGFDPGLLQGQITAADNAMPLPGIFVQLDPPFNNQTFSVPGFSGPPALPSGSFNLADTQLRDQMGTATINPAGFFNNPDFETAQVQFELRQNQVTMCNVPLPRVGGEVPIFADSFENPGRSDQRGTPPPPCTPVP